MLAPGASSMAPRRRSGLQEALQGCKKRQRMGGAVHRHTGLCSCPHASSEV